MAKDPQRREMILHALQESRLEALASFLPTEVLLLTGYAPVMEASLAVCTRQGNLCGIIPKDELELGETTSHAEFFAYESQTLRRLTSLSEALVHPVTKLVARVHLKPGHIGAKLGSRQDLQHRTRHLCRRCRRHAPLRRRRVNATSR
jgi:hypothetical protein